MNQSFDLTFPLLTELVIPYQGICRLVCAWVFLILTTSYLSRFVEKNRLLNFLFLAVLLYFIPSALTDLFIFKVIGIDIYQSSEVNLFTPVGILFIISLTLWFYRKNRALTLQVLDTIFFTGSIALALYWLWMIIFGPRLGRIIPAGGLFTLPLGGHYFPFSFFKLINLLFCITMSLWARKYTRRPGVIFFIIISMQIILTIITNYFRADLGTSSAKWIYHNSLLLLLLMVFGPLFISLFIKKYFPFTSEPLAHPLPLQRQFLLGDFARLRVNNLQDMVTYIKLFLFLPLSLGFILIGTDTGKWRYTQSSNEEEPLYIPARMTNVMMINVPSGELYYKNRIFTISPGSRRTQTPIGTGYVADKRKRIKFQYTTGPKRGQIMLKATTLDGKLFNMPYYKMRGIGLDINGYRDYVIHSTTKIWNLAYPASHGCIRMNIPDMLELYKIVEVNTPVTVDYILVTLDGPYVIFYKDIYRLNKCVIDGKSIDLFAYTFQMIKNATGKEISYKRFNKIVPNLSYKIYTAKVPVKQFYE